MLLFEGMLGYLVGHLHSYNHLSFLLVHPFQITLEEKEDSSDLQADALDIERQKSPLWLSNFLSFILKLHLDLF